MSEIVEIGALRIKRNRFAALRGQGCQHLQMEFDDHGQFIECADCKKQLGLYWAFGVFIEHYLRWRREFEEKRKALQEAVAKEITLLAAKKIEKAWRSRSMVPICPHCHRGIFPSDRFGESAISRELEIKRREKRRQNGE